MKWIEQDDYVIQDTRNGYYCKQIGEEKDLNKLVQKIADNMQKENFRPNTWQVNDHGNVSLLSIRYVRPGFAPWKYANLEKYSEQREMQELEAKLENTFQKEFMKPEVVRGEYWSVEGRMCNEWLPVEVTDRKGLANFCENKIDDKNTRVSKIKGYGARLSASGYLDCTEWSVFKTKREAIEHLLEIYGDEVN